MLEAIRDLGLELQIIFNKGAVMVLPAGVNKASGLAVALARLGLSPHNVVGVGDAENDHAFLRCLRLLGGGGQRAAGGQGDRRPRHRGRRAAPAWPSWSGACWTTTSPPWQGLWARHLLRLGATEDGGEVAIGPRECALVAGVVRRRQVHAGHGRARAAGRARLAYCLIDPEGDYEELGDAVQLGDARRAPRVGEFDDVLATPERSLVVSLLALDSADRPGFLAQLLPRFADLRARTGRPHWLIVDEAHHMLPANWAPAPSTLPDELRACLFVTVHPGELAPALLARIAVVVAVGGDPAGTLADFAAATGRPAPAVCPRAASARRRRWSGGRGGQAPPLRIRKARPVQRMRRHLRKYSEGELGPDTSFYFRGPEGALNLRAYNLSLFLQLADGVDDATWMHHLRAGDYSRWLRMAIKDDELADEVAAVEADPAADPATSRQRIREPINARYIAPAAG